MRRALALVAVAMLAAGCASEGMAFRQDDRLEIVSPDDRSEVTLPLELRWRADLEAETYFAVFIDRAPVRPGESLDALADDTCEDTPGCPDLQYFRDRYVYVTDEDGVTVDAVPQTSASQRTGADDRHEATVVLIDREGRRIGESAYTVEFTLEGEG